MEDRNKIYIDIDVLFDTRYNTLSKIDKVDNESYLTRKSDNFKYIGLKQFLFLYKKRNRNVLLSSETTNIYGAIINSILRKKRDIVDKGISDDIKIDINHYPYLLNEDDKQGLLGYISSHFEGIEISFIYKKKDIWITNGYFDIFVYDGIDVLDMLTTKYEIYKNPLPNMTLSMPSIVQDESSVVDFDKLFLGMMDIYRMHIDLQFIDISNYCNIKIVEEYNNTI